MRADFVLPDRDTPFLSSRKLEQASYDSVAFRYITGNQHPDHDTISSFRQRFSSEVKEHVKYLFPNNSKVLLCRKEILPFPV